MRSIEINPTCVPQSAEALGECLSRVRQFVNRAQIDIDDGIFAPHLTWPYASPGSFSSVEFPRMEGAILEIHLMVAEPKDIGIACARAGAERLIGHFEALGKGADVAATFKLWRESGAKEIGLGVLMQTPPDALYPFMHECDFILMMSIATIGVQGIPYDTRAPARIAEFHAQYPDIPIAVDGGVSEANIVALVRAGASRFGVGSAIMKSDDPKRAYEKLKTLAENA